MNGVKRYALSDMHNYLSNTIEDYSKNKEIVKPSHLDTIDTLRLNNQLGLKGINFKDNLKNFKLKLNNHVNNNSNITNSYSIVSTNEYTRQ